MTDNTEKAKQILGYLEVLIDKEKDIDRKYALYAARDNMIIAIRRLEADDLDNAGRYIKAAHKAFLEVRA